MQIRCCNFFYHFGELVLRFSDTFPIVGIYNKYEALGVLEIVPPEGSNFVLTADIPNGETDVFVFHGLNIETWKNWQFSINSKSFSRIFRRDKDFVKVNPGSPIRQIVQQCQRHQGLEMIHDHFVIKKSDDIWCLLIHNPKSSRIKT